MTVPVDIVPFRGSGFCERLFMSELVSIFVQRFRVGVLAFISGGPLFGDRGVANVEGGVGFVSGDAVVADFYHSICNDLGLSNYSNVCAHGSVLS